MAYEHKEGYGAIFRNNKKKGEKEPDFRGNIMLAGVVYDIAGWTKTGSKGSFLSIKGQPERAKTHPADNLLDGEMDKDSDSIPF